jgi:hypothetical protein
VAESRLDGFTTGPLVIGQSLASARITQTPGAAPKKESSFTLGSLRIAGVEVAMTDDGFKLGDQAPPTADMAQLFGILAQAGITVEFLPASETPTSIDSAGLRITRAGADPNGTQYKIALVVGRVGASITGGNAPLLSAEPTVVVSESEPATPAAAPGGAPADVGPVMPAEEAGGTVDLAASQATFATDGVTAVTAVEPGASAAGLAADGATSASAAPITRLAAPAYAIPGSGPDATSFYTALVVAGLLMLAGTRLTARVGVRLGGGAAGSGADVRSVLRLPGR